MTGKAVFSVTFLRDISKKKIVCRIPQDVYIQSTSPIDGNGEYHTKYFIRTWSVNAA